MSLTLSDLSSYINMAIEEDHLIGILFTSEASGYLKSDGWSYGAGKSTLAMNYAKYIIYKGDFEEVKKHLIGFAWQLRPFLENPTPTKCVLWEDLQIDVGKNKAHDPDVQALAYHLTIERPHLKVLIGTTSHRGMLQKDFRELLFNFEVIVPERGSYEIQMLKRRIQFDNPSKISERFNINPQGLGNFFKLLPEEQMWYDQWRDWRDAEARKRVKLLRAPPEEGIKKNITSAEFYSMAHELGLKGDQHKYHELWRKCAALQQQ